MNEPQPGQMAMTDIVAGAWNLYRRRFMYWSVLALPSVVAAFALNWVVAARTGVGQGDGTEQIDPTDPLINAVSFATFFAALFAYVVVLRAATGLLMGRPVTVRAAYVRGGRRYLPVAATAFGLVLVLSLAIALAGVVPIVGIVMLCGAAFFLVRWSMFAQAAVVESRSPRRAVSRSNQVVQGEWWRTLGTSVSILLLALIPSIFLGGLAGISGVAPVVALGAAAGAAVSIPFASIAHTLLYADLRARKGERPFASPVQGAL